MPNYAYMRRSLDFIVPDSSYPYERCNIWVRLRIVVPRLYSLEFALVKCLHCIHLHSWCGLVKSNFSVIWLMFKCLHRNAFLFLQDLCNEVEIFALLSSVNLVSYGYEYSSLPWSWVILLGLPLLGVWLFVSWYLLFLFPCICYPWRCWCNVKLLNLNTSQHNHHKNSRDFSQFYKKYENFLNS